MAAAGTVRPRLGSSCPYFSYRTQMPPKSDRNRRISAAFDAGQKLEQLAQAHCVTPARIRAILTAEHHRRIVSPEPFYRALRSAALS